MIPPSIPEHEGERLAALDRYAILDTSPEEAFGEIVHLASSFCDAPIALITLIDATRQWFKARVGLDATETPRKISFCGHAICAGDDVFVVEDATADPRFADNPLVTATPNIRFYAGAPLVTPDGYNLGTLCVIDDKPRTLSGPQRLALRALARQVMVQLELRRQLNEVERMKMDFVSTVSHELRTPLTSIRGSLSLLASGVMGELPAEALPVVTVAERNSIRLIALINDILDFDKLESGRMEMELRPTPLLRVLERSIESISTFAMQEGVDIELHCGDVTVTGDETRLSQVTVNLLSNAVKHSHRGGVVRVTGAAEDGLAVVRVEDFGEGIPAALQTRLFQRFQRTDSSDARLTPGTGLGLAICKAIVEQHGGSIGMESAEGAGSTFWFRIACVPARELV
ncbi:MAG TPA: ATP-binding protein [Thermoanaerobaculia bacterium]